MIPLVDLSLQHREIAAEVNDGWQRVLAATNFILGEDVARFEEEYARFCGVAHCIGVGSGTDALEFALRSAGVEPGDEVLLPANSFVASALAPMRMGARPVLIDIDPATQLIDQRAAEAAIGPRTRAIMPVHLYGQVAPLDDIAPMLGERGIPVVEDAAQAHGAIRHGIPAGGLGLVAATSFYPGKNLGAYGDGGAVLTNDDGINLAVRRLRNWGGNEKYRHEILGFNSRLDTIQAVVLRAKLRRLHTWNEDRRSAAAHYDHMLKALDEVQRPSVVDGNEHVWHLYVVQVPNRDAVLEHLQRSGIGAGVHYPVPIHRQPALAHLGYAEGDFPRAEAAAGRLLSLPLFPGITIEQQDKVVETLAAALEVGVKATRGA
ncbi:MAG: DegT/DnrJ/EryC1/StrS family aminotransferase [Actinomycetota bacterium]